MLGFKGRDVSVVLEKDVSGPGVGSELSLPWVSVSSSAVMASKVQQW